MTRNIPNSNRPVVVHEASEVEAGNMYILQRESRNAQEPEYLAVSADKIDNITYLHDGHTVPFARIKEYGWKLFGPISIDGGGNDGK